MAEVHGCGAEAKTKARQQIARDGKLYPGSGIVAMVDTFGGVEEILLAKPSLCFIDITFLVFDPLSAVLSLNYALGWLSRLVTN